jgi:hypothetical protein
VGSSSSNLGSRDQELGQLHAHQPAAGELGQRLLPLLLREPQADQRGAQLGVGREAARALELVAERVVARGQVLGHVVVRARDLPLERAHAPLQGAQRLERGLGLRARCARDRRHLLAQVAHPRAAAQVQRSGVGRVEPGEHAQEGGLAGAVAADQAHAVLRAHVQRGVLEQHAPAERLRHVLDAQHGAGL